MTTINSWNSVDGSTKHVMGCSQTCAGCSTVRECQRIAAECPNLAQAIEPRDAEIANLRAQLAAVGAGGVSERLMGAAPTTGWPPGLLQDDSRDLSKALANTPHARAHVKEAAMLSAAPMPPTAQPAEPDMPAICAALGFDPTNHHNAARCPYCTPTTQPQQSTQVQPKIPPFIGSLHSYKTVWTHLEAEQIEDYGRRCFAAGISAGHQPQQSAPVQQSAVMPEFEVVGWVHSHTGCFYDEAKDMPLADGDESAEALVRFSDVAAAWRKGVV